MQKETDITERAGKHQLGEDEEQGRSAARVNAHTRAGHEDGGEGETLSGFPGSRGISGVA